MKAILLFGTLSLLLHLSIFLFAPAEKKFHIPLKRGEPFEITKTEKGKPSSSVSKKPEELGSSPSEPTGETTSPTGKGISDGSEFGIAKPTYPESSRLRGEEGKVLIKLILDEKSHLVTMELLESSGVRALDKAALSQIEKDLPSSQNPTRTFEHVIQFNFRLPRQKQ